jgi:signal peptidase I
VFPILSFLATRSLADLLNLVIAIGIGATLSWWVAYDAARRGRAWYAWGTFVWFTTIVGIGVWLVMRRRWPVVASGRGLSREFARGVALAVPLTIVSLVVNTLLVAYVVQRARVEARAMEPTLVPGQHVWVNKLAYRQAAPQRGDVVMLSYPKDPKRTFVLRIIAIEGDRLRVEDGRVFVNDRPVREDFVPAEYRSHEYVSPIVVPPGSYFVMGDRRNYASDSRRWGLVPRNNVLGRIYP